MRMYFCGSIRGGRQDVAIYQRIVRKLQEFGLVLTEHVSHADVSERGEDVELQGDLAIHDRDMQWLHTADVVVAEVTQPSLGVGYEVGRAVDMQKKILCLFRPSSGQVLSAMIRGADDGSPNSFVQVRDYAEDEVETVLDTYFSTFSSTV
ncbi:2'-deoxynucleoside 5'-phosphate N-hydrolase 1 [Arapaima gigas]